MPFIGATAGGLSRSGRGKPQPTKRRQEASTTNQPAVPKKSRAITIKAEKPEERQFLTSTPKSGAIKLEKSCPMKMKVKNKSKELKPNKLFDRIDEEEENEKEKEAGEESDNDPLNYHGDNDFVENLMTQLNNLPRKDKSGRGAMTPVKVNPYVGTPDRSPESSGFITRPPQPPRIRAASSESEQDQNFGGGMRDSIETEALEGIFRGELSGAKSGTRKRATKEKEGGIAEEAQYLENEEALSEGNNTNVKKRARGKVVEMETDEQSAEDALSQLFQVHQTQSTQAFMRQHPGEQLDEDFGLEDNDISSIQASRDNSMVEEEEGDQLDDEQFDEVNDEQEEEDEQNLDDDNGEEAQLVDAASRNLNATSKMVSRRVLATDKENATQSVFDAVKEKINRLRRAKSVVRMVALSIMEIEDDDEMQPDVIREMEQSFEDQVLTPDALTLVGWNCRARKRVVIEDGRHRLCALKNYLNKKNTAIVDKSKHYNFNEFEVRVQLVQGDKLSARIRKMTMEHSANPSVFEKVMRINFIMNGLQMMKNMTMQVRWILINEQIRGGGVPMYQVHAACMSRKELAVIMHGARTLTDNSTLLKLYLRARQVNKGSALKIWEQMDRETDITTHNNLRRKLNGLLNDIMEMLVYKGYEEEDARGVQERLYKCANAYSTMKRLVTSKTGLCKIGSELNGFLLDLEHCLPPATFIRPRITAITRVNQSKENTLFIIDIKEFKDDVIRHLLGMASKQGRPMNILVIDGLIADVKGKIATVQNERRQEARRRPRREDGSQPTDPNESLVDSPASQSAARLSSSSSSQSDSNIGVISVTVGCAPFIEGTGIGAITRTTVTACLMRADDNEFLDDESLGRFLNKMRISGTVTRSALRLLSFNHNKPDQISRPNALFLHCSTPGAAAVAAQCSCYRITVLTSLPDDLKDLLIKMQGEMDDNWKDWKTYKSMFTQDGVIRTAPGLVRKRNRKSMLKQARSSGLIRNES